MSVGTDRNLLFGVLAMQMNFITRDQLVAAMYGWVPDKARPLGHILLEQKALFADTYTLLEALIEKHLALHDEDPQKSLAAVSSAGSVKKDLAEIADADLQAGLVHIARPRGESSNPAGEDADPNATVSAVGTLSSAGLRFRIVRPHAHGGLGEVFVAHDQELHREIALKQIRAHHADDGEARSRFLLEAEITGGLEHPGIVPVYGLGQYSDGRPFYAMRFIKGDSLKDAIERFHHPKPRGESSNFAGSGALHDSLALRKMLGRFIDVCEAIQYAHDRGVLHRDLKPGNIMLGKYGETLVVDWGLAKAGVKSQGSGVSSEPEASAMAEAPLVPASASGSSETLPGSAIGTPSFMSPEQAAGRLDQLGPASDVYSLGATLYCLLTGKPPVEGTDAAEILKRVREGDIPRPRQLAPDVDRALEAICVKAMALTPADRYRAPRGLADDLERWLADKPVGAWPEPWTVRSRRRVRQHQTFVTSSAASLFIALVALTAGLLLYQDEQNRRASEQTLRDLEAARKKAQAEEGIRHALDQAQDARDDLHKKLKESGGVFALLNHPENWEARLKVAQAALDRAKALFNNADQGADPELDRRALELQTLLAQDDKDRLLAVRLEKIRMERATLDDGKFDYRKAAEEYPQAFAGADLAIHKENVGDVAARIAASSIKEELVAALDDWAWVGFRQGTNDLPEQLLAVARQAAPDLQWGDRLRRVEIWRDQQGLMALVQTAPGTGLSPQTLGLVGYLLEERTPLRESWFRQAHSQYPADFWLNFELANALRKSNAAEAAGYHWAAIAVRPGSSPAYYNLGNALYEQKKLPEAIAAYEKAIEIDPRYAAAYNNLGLALHEQKKLPEAIAALEKAIEINSKDAAAHSNLGNALREQKKLPAAIAAHQEAIKIDSGNAKAYSNLGLALHDQKKLLEAIAAYKKAIEIDREHASAYNNLGTALVAQKKLPEAIAAYKKAIEIETTYAEAYNNLGIALYYQHKLPEAVAAFQKALEIDPRKAKPYNNLGNVLREQRKLPEAIAAFQTAIKIETTYAEAYNNLGITLVGQKKLPEAIAAFQKAIDLGSDFPQPHGALGNTLFLKGSFSEAAASLQIAVDLLPPSHSLRALYLNVIKQCQQMKALEERLPEVLDGTAPAALGEQLLMASMCQEYQERHVLAVQLYQQSFKVQPGLLEDEPKQHRYKAARSAALAGTGQGEEAGKLGAGEKARLRQEARAWLQADLNLYAKKVQDGKVEAVLLTEQRLSHWQGDADLAAVRDAKSLAALPEPEQAAWRKLWADVDQLLKQVWAGIPTLSTHESALTDPQHEQVHEMRLEASKTYVIDMQSKELNSYLKLHDAAGKLLAENDDIAPDNLDARIIFTPKQDGTYRITATSIQECGRGKYTLTIRAVAANGK